MKIVILGAGQVGSTVARSLSHEDNDISVVDTDAGRLRDMANHLDLRSREVLDRLLSATKR